MKKEQIDKLVELISDLVSDTSDGATWIDKRDAILTECTKDDRTNLEEFCSWFIVE